MNKVYVALAAAFVALGISVSTALQAPSAPAVGVTGITRLVHDELQKEARSAGVKIVYEKLLAYRVDGDESVARVKIRYTAPAIDWRTGKITVESKTLVLVLRFRRSVWQLEDAKAA